jgi:hypothetical protein
MKALAHVRGGRSWTGRVCNGGAGSRDLDMLFSKVEEHGCKFHHMFGAE